MPTGIGSDIYALISGIKTVIDTIATGIAKLAAEITVGGGLKVNGAVTTSGTVTEASAANILAALNKIVPVTSSEYATTTSTAADAEIVLATQHIDTTNGVIVSISQDTYILLAQTTGGATTTSMIFKAGTHYIPFTFTHLVHKAVTSNGTITLIGKYVA